MRLLGDFALRDRLFERLLLVRLMERLFDLLLTERDLDAVRKDTEAGVLLRPDVGLLGVLALRLRDALFAFLRADERERERLELADAELGARFCLVRLVLFRALRLRGVLFLLDVETDRDVEGALGTEALRRRALRRVRRAARRFDLLRERELGNGLLGFFAFFLSLEGSIARFFAARFLLYSSFSAW